MPMSSPSALSVYICLLFVLLNVFSIASEEISLESSLLSCHSDDAIDNLLIKNPIRLATTQKGNSKKIENAKGYSKCRKVLIITLRISESVKEFVSDALVIVDHGKNKLTDRVTKFGNPLVIKFHQDKLVQKYSLKYLYKVNGKMWEEVINHESRSNYTGCIDEEKLRPTCGFTSGEVKQVAGFCCSCGDHKGDVQQRGGQRCDTPGMTSEQLTSAHCLRAGPFYYNVYEVGEPMIYQQVRFEMFKSNELINGSLAWRKLSESDDGVVVDSLNPVAASGSIKVTYRPHLERIGESNILLKPDTHPRLLYPNLNPFITQVPEQLQGSIEDQILIVPKSMMAPHGAKCDHVGTGIHAFVSQEHPCRLERGACLRNQPFDLWKLDQGPHGDHSKKYKLKSYAPPEEESGTPPFVEFDADIKTGSVYMEYKAEAPTFIDVELPADDLILLSPGYNALIESVLTDTGAEGAKVVVQVMNREYVSASFSAKLAKCAVDNNGKGEEKSSKSFSTTSSKKRIAPLGATHFYINMLPYQISQPVFCFVVLVNEFGETIAAREIILQPKQTCLCVHTCKCACGDETNLKCEPLSDENIIAAGLFNEMMTAEDQERELKYRNKYTMILHWVLFGHAVLAVLCACIWIRKRFCKRKSAEEEGKDENENNNNGEIETDDGNGSEITLYKRESLAKENASTSEASSTFANNPTESSAQQVSSTFVQGSQSILKDPSLLSNDDNPSENPSKSNVHFVDVLATEASKSSSATGAEDDGGPQFSKLSFREEWKNRQDSTSNFDADNNTFLYLLSASSSKTNLGLWDRRKREQLTAYDYLPNRKGS